MPQDAQPDGLPTDPARASSQRRLPPAPADARPGFCAEHPGYDLVPPRRAGSSWDTRRAAIVCAHPDHDLIDRNRCTYCGGPLYRDWRPGAMPRGDRRTCSSTCRNYLWRWFRAKEGR